MKATAGKIGDKTVEIFKDPVTDSGTKKSAKGYLKVIKDASGEFVLVDQITEDQMDDPDNEMIAVFRNGRLLQEDSLESIRKRLHPEW